MPILLVMVAEACIPCPKRRVLNGLERVFVASSMGFIWALIFLLFMDRSACERSSL